MVVTSDKPDGNLEVMLVSLSAESPSAENAAFLMEARSNAATIGTVMPTSIVAPLPLIL